MRLKDKIAIAGKVVRAKFLNEKIPLVVGWSLTNNCNLNCKYCKRWQMAGKELKTHEVFSVLNELRRLNTKIISFTGGEPLLRSDIGDIIDYAHKKRIYLNINTNGTLFLEKVNELNNINSVRFSLDGTEEVNDYIRGKETFRKVIQAVRMAIHKRLKVAIVTVLSKYNLDSIDYLINLAEKLNVGIIFQPITLTLLDSSIANPHIPDPQEYKNTITKLIEYKKRKNPILNTREGLYYLWHWPEGKNIYCFARNISCRIETDGRLYHCGRYRDEETALDCLTNGVKKSFNTLNDASCNDCWCALRLETNFIANLSSESIFTILKKGI